MVMAGAIEELPEGRNGSAGVMPDLERMEGNGEMNPMPVDPVQALPTGKFVKDAEEAVAAEEAADGGPEKKKPVVPKVSFFALFKFANGYDYLLMILAFFGAVGDGSSFAIMLAVLGGLINSFGSHANGTSQAEFDSKVKQASAAPAATCVLILLFPKSIGLHCVVGFGCSMQGRGVEFASSPKQLGNGTTPVKVIGFSLELRLCGAMGNNVERIFC